MQQLRREAQGEGLHPHPEEFGQQEMAQLVDEDQDPQDYDGRQSGDHNSLYAPVGEIVIISVGDPGRRESLTPPVDQALGKIPGPLIDGQNLLQALQGWG